MSLIFKTEDYDDNELYFIEPVKNNVKTNSFFSRIVYSNDIISLKNIYFSFTLTNVSFKDQYLKTIIYFNESSNDLQKLYEIEKDIINKFIQYKQIYNKDINIQPTYCIKNQFKLNYIKIFKNSAITDINYNSTEILIKISGIWQTDNNVGITFKFI